MISSNTTICPKCGGRLKRYDSVRRIVRVQAGKSHRVIIDRYICIRCHSTHRELPKDLFPRKHYAARIIQGVLDGTITSDDLEYEDYPCESTIVRWRKSTTLIFHSL